MKKKSALKKKQSSRFNQINWKVVFYSVIALICLALVYFWDWIFIVPALFFVWLNHRELFFKK